MTVEAEDLIGVRDRGEQQEPAERAVTLLSLASPETDAGALRRLTLGHRNARLLALHARLFGPALEAYAECPHCGAALELPMSVDDFVPPGAIETSAAALDLDADGYALRFRLIDSDDVLAASHCPSVAAARALFVERCLLEARHDGRAVSADELPPKVIDRLSQRMEECDPGADTLLNLVCPACQRAWQIAFDVASFLYSEVAGEARRALREVHALARAYAWSEREILAMHPRRRRDYLEMLLE
ncbi:MAG TPA: phage baseplate protein [Thermoanaerobaculia bacterium]|jgi:hypothetical protein